MAIQETSTAGHDLKPEKIDPKELAEREAAAKAYAGESPQHFVDYCMDCVDISIKSMLDIRRMQEECWRVFNEEEPDTWSLKEIWQSKITYPKPNKLVRVGQAFTRKAFDVDFLSIENEKDPFAAKFWTDYMGLQVTRNYANFPLNFSDATAWALAIGTSAEIIPRWVNGKGIELILENPENIHRDPVAESRQPWSGRYWVHQAWQSFADLKKGEKNGIYKNIQDFSVGGGFTDSPDLQPEEIARRKNMVYLQGKFNQIVMVSEFHGRVLSPRGEELLPRAWYTVAGNQVIRKPEATRYPNIRWPGVGFSALPNLRRFDGRGLIQGIRSLWYFANNLLSLHADNLNWVVNPITEVNTDVLRDPMDNEYFPGKYVMTYATEQGQQALRTIDRNTRNNDILAMLAKIGMLVDDGSPVDQNMQGSPGWRSYVTKGEREINQGQSDVTMGSMATDIEDGALNVIKAMADTVIINLTYDELKKIFPEHAEKYRVPVSAQFPTGLDLPKLTSGNFKIAGIQAFMKHQENLQNLQGMEPLFAKDSVFLPYLKPYEYLTARVKYTDLVDSKILITKEQAQAIDQAQQGQQEAAIGHQGAQIEAEAQAAQMEAAKRQAQAEKAGAEAQANQSQAGLFDAQAAAAVAQPPGYGGEV